jgi:hypothetical protein
MNDEQIQRVVAEVISRLVPRLGADGRRGCLIIVFSGATAAFGEAIRQVRALILDGYQLSLAFSQAAEQLCGRAVRDQLVGFPHLSFVEPDRWLTSLREARAVVCPLLSVNTVSKLSLLIADSLVTNLLLHGLFMGKTVIVARDGVDLTNQDRKALGIHDGTPSLQRAVAQRLQTVAEYGCCVTPVHYLRETVNSVLRSDELSTTERRDHKGNSIPATLTHSGKVVTAADVRNAHRTGTKLSISAASLVTPLARELAVKHGVVLEQRNDGSSH